MISCDDFLNTLSDYLDGDISESKTRLINSHLAACPSCKLLFEKTRNVVRTVNHLPKVKATDSFQQRLEMRIQKEIEIQQTKGIERMTQSIGAIPIKPVLATLTAAAAITAFSILAGNQFFSENQNKPVVSPRLSTPPMPGRSQTNVPLQKSYLQQSGLTTAGVVQDSSRMPDRLTDDQYPDAQDILESLKNQSQAVREVKDRKQ